jgi:hypothetical protein
MVTPAEAGAQPERARIGGIARTPYPMLARCSGMEKIFAFYILASQRNGTLCTGVTNPEWRDLYAEVCG